MQLEKKENYTLITSEENSFNVLLASFLKIEKELENENIFLYITDCLKFTSNELKTLIDYANKKKENSTSFVIINTTVNIDNFPENFNIVPTLQEAEDILEMEAIERELGF